MASNLSTNLSNFATLVGTDVKSLLDSIGDVSQLTTTQKANLVVALNEVKASISTAVSGLIDDSATANGTTWSSTKINNAISQAINDLINGADSTMDTLKELADAIDANAGLIEGLTAIAQNHVKYNEAQTLTDDQKTTARTNIGAASASDVTTLSGTVSSLSTRVGNNETAIGTVSQLQTTNKTLVPAVNEVRTTAQNAYTKAETAETGVSTLTTNLGDLTVDYSTVYNTAKNGTSS